MTAIQKMGQYLTFKVGDEIFALNISSVREVLELGAITRVPRTPEHMRGVLNLRGHAVPVVDMRLKLGMERGTDSVDTCTIIVELDQGGEKVIIGAVVDSVLEVFEIPLDSVEEPPGMGLALETNYIEGMGKQGDRFVIILDIARIFSAEELAVARSLVTEEVS